MWKVGAESCPDGVPSREGGDTPRVTREMVEGDSALGRNVDSSLSCGLCGASLYVPEEGVLVPASPVNVVERHRQWHDRLERLLEGKG